MNFLSFILIINAVLLLQEPDFSCKIFSEKMFKHYFFDKRKFDNCNSANSLSHIISSPHKKDPCEESRVGAAQATKFAKENIFIASKETIQLAFISDSKEHCIAFRRDSLNQLKSSAISAGDKTMSIVPFIENAFADLHNHTNNTAPDAGDLYGLIELNKKNEIHRTRFVMMLSGAMYALLITDSHAANRFTLLHPKQAPASKIYQPAFPEAIVDELRELKYKYGCADEMAVAFMLEKYNTGVSLLKRQEDGAFIKIRTLVSGDADHLNFSVVTCR